MEPIISNYIHILSEHLAMDLTAYDSSFLKRTVESRMDSQRINSYQGYIEKLENEEEEQDVLRRSLNNSYSEFFRSPLTFDYLEYILLPLICEQKRRMQEKEIRIWSAACAGGQEAYSLAILCDELLQGKGSEITCRVFATDHCADELEKARKGLYSMQNMGKVSLDRFKKYFELEEKEEVYRVISPLRKIVDFSIFDLLSIAGSSPPSSIYGDFDIVFCSNLLFYYKHEFRQAILQKLGRSLRTGGYLITGEAEREIVKANSYSEVFSNSAIFQKR